MNETVDILLATYNTKIEYLKEQLDSILKQTYKNIHLIISDDASTKEDVCNVIKTYQEKDNRITVYFQEKNLGYSRNFEFLLQESKAQFIMFSDHDDIWYPEKVEKCLKRLIETKSDLVYCDAKQIDENGNVLHESYLKYKNLPFLNGKNDIHFFARHTVLGCSQMFTKNVRDKMIPFKKEKVAHDWISIYIANIGKGVEYIKEPLLGYRLHSKNVFGGRSFKQNIKLWKSKNGLRYKSYLEYRKKVINNAYLDGAEKCFDYSNKENVEEQKVIDYYKYLIKSKVISFKISNYFKYLYFKGASKRAIKEIIIFHFQLIGYIAYLLG